jgi:hypothetical protein
MAQLKLVTVKSENGLTPVSANGQLLNVKKMLDLAANGADTMIEYEGGFGSSRILVDETYASLATDVASYLTKNAELATTGKNGNGKALTMRINSDTINRAFEDIKNKSVVSGITGANAGDLFTLPSGSVVAGARIRFTEGTVSNFALNTNYYVFNPSGATFQISLTPSGGSAIVLAADVTGLKAEIYQKSVLQVTPALGMSEVNYSTDSNLVQIAAAFNA